MALLKGDKFNGGVIQITGVTPTHVNFQHTLTGYNHSMSKSEFNDILKDGIYHTQERRVF